MRIQEGRTSGSDWVTQSDQGVSQEMLSVTGTHGCFHFSLQRAQILAGLLSPKAVSSSMKSPQSLMALRLVPKLAISKNVQERG